MSNLTKLSARDRIESLLDDGGFVEIGGLVTARSTDFNMQEKETPADGVITGSGSIDGNLVYVYSQDASVLGGSIGEMHAKKIAKIYNMAMKVGAPVIALIDCAGLRLQEATDALTAFGRIYQKQAFASGVIPQITAVFGNCGGGAAIIPALSDFTFMTKEDSKLFVNSPNALEGNYEEKCDTASAAFHSEESGLCDVVCDTEMDVLTKIRELVCMLPACNEDSTFFAESEDDLNRTIPGLDGLKDDARAVIENIADNGTFFETKKGYAPGMVTGLIKLGGATIGVIANQTKDGGDKLSANGAQKAAELVNFCDSFNLPILTLTAVNGYVACKCSEKKIAKAVAELTYAFANANVPKVNLIIGEAYGSAYVTMNSKSLGNDIEFAWPGAKIGMMEPEMAVKIIYAEELSKADDKKAFINEKKKEYASLQASATEAARRGYVDDIIEPDATRKRLIAAFEMLYTKAEDRPYKKHGSI